MNNGLILLEHARFLASFFLVYVYSFILFFIFIYIFFYGLLVGNKRG